MHDSRALICMGNKTYINDKIELDLARTLHEK